MARIAMKAADLLASTGNKATRMADRATIGGRIFRPVGPTDVDAERPAWDAVTILVIVAPVLGTFNPLEQYLAVGADADPTRATVGATTSTYVVALSLLTLALYLACGRSFAIVTRLGSLLLAALPLVAFLSALWSPDPTFTVNRSARLIPYIGFGLVFSEYLEFETIVRLLTRSFFVAISCSILVVLIRPDFGLSQIGGGYEYAWRGATIHKNILGQVCAISLLVCSFSIVLRANAVALSLTTFAMSAVALALSRSATSIVAGGLSLATAAALAAFARTPFAAKLAAFAVLVAATLIIAVFAADATSLLSLLGRDDTFTGRTHIWIAVAAAIGRSPWWGYFYGFWGIDSADRDVIWRQVAYHVPHSHDSWLDVWMQLGLPGLLILAAVGLIVIVKGVARYFASTDPISVFCLSLLVYLLVRAAPEVEFSDPFPSGLFWLALNYGLLSCRRHSATTRS